MDLRMFLQLLRNHWKMIAAITVLAGVASGVLTARMTPRYASSVTFYVSAQANTTDPSMAYQGALLSQQAAQSYADLLTGPRLANSVIRYLGLPMTPPQLTAEISARSIPQTVLLTATVTDTSPQRLGGSLPPSASASCGWCQCLSARQASGTRRSGSPLWRPPRCPARQFHPTRLGMPASRCCSAC